MTCFPLLIALMLAEPTLTKEATPAPAAWPASFRDALDADVWVCELSDTKLSFRFRKQLDGKATTEQRKNGLSARELTEGQLVGVLDISKPFTDFRKQTIAAGSYTLRLGFQPDIGDHKGTAPYTEFLLLTPLKDDTSAEDIDVDTLRKRSMPAAGGDHPAVMLLVPQKGEGDAKLEAKKNGVRLMTITQDVNLGTDQEKLRLGIVVEGWSETR